MYINIYICISCCFFLRFDLLIARAQHNTVNKHKTYDLVNWYTFFCSCWFLLVFIALRWAIKLLIRLKMSTGKMKFTTKQTNRQRNRHLELNEWFFIAISYRRYVPLEFRESWHDIYKYIDVLCLYVCVFANKAMIWFHHRFRFNLIEVIGA